ncbi:hypothetical protein AGMMS50268_37620 [Spirochaetia bacterium]|nr:hypothetical protein AGMMS50268_37620 [Spirochaetia bacterium]
MDVLSQNDLNSLLSNSPKPAPKEEPAKPVFKFKFNFSNIPQTPSDPSCALTQDELNEVLSHATKLF